MMASAASLRESVRIILVRTQFATNLGAAARVLKNMGIGRLTLVDPQCEVGIEARAIAMKGAEVLDQAKYAPSLEAAARDVAVLVGTSARFEPGVNRITDYRTFANRVLPMYAEGGVGLVFGSEDNGLWRDEIALCHWIVRIPTGSSDYPVLNLAQSVAVMAYEVNLAAEAAAGAQAGRTSELATPESATSGAGEEVLRRAGPEHVESVIQRALRMLERGGFPPHLKPERLEKRLRKLVGRAQLEVEDVNMLHGLLGVLERKGPSGG